MDQPEAGPSRTTPPPLQHSSSDEPLIIESTVASRRPQRIPRKASARSSIPPKPKVAKKTTVEKGKGKPKGKGKGKEIETILIDESTDEDEPVFVGVASKLAEKYTFKSTSSASITSSNGIVAIQTPDNGQAESDKPKPAPLILHPPLSPQGKPPAIPAWLGKSSILLQIPYCVVCKLRWKKENGAARWVGFTCCRFMFAGLSREGKVDVSATHFYMSTSSLSTS
jgi:hypothetical protein